MTTPGMAPPDELELVERLAETCVADGIARGLLSAIAARCHRYDLALAACTNSQDRRQGCRMLRALVRCLGVLR